MELQKVYVCKVKVSIETLDIRNSNTVAEVIKVKP
jgi:hypothetical protein